MKPHLIWTILLLLMGWSCPSAYAQSSCYERFLAEGQQAFSEYNLDMAIKKFKAAKVCEDKPASDTIIDRWIIETEARVRLIANQLEENRRELENAKYELALTDSVNASIAHADSLRAAGAFDAALQLYEKAILLGDENPGLRLNLRPAYAAAEAIRFRKLEQERSDGLIENGDSLASLGYSYALNAFEKYHQALAIGADSALVWGRINGLVDKLENCLAMECYADFRRSLRAWQRFKHSLNHSLRQTAINMRLSLAEIYIRTGRKEASQIHLQSIYDSSPLYNFNQAYLSPEVKELADKLKPGKKKNELELSTQFFHFNYPDGGIFYDITSRYQVLEISGEITNIWGGRLHYRRWLADWEDAGILLGGGAAFHRTAFFSTLSLPNGSRVFNLRRDVERNTLSLPLFAELFSGELESFALICHLGASLNYYTEQFEDRVLVNIDFKRPPDLSTPFPGIMPPSTHQLSFINDSPPPLRRFHGLGYTLYFQANLRYAIRETIFLTLGAHLQDEFVPDDEPAGISEQDLFLGGLFRDGEKNTRTVTLNFGLGYRF